MNKVYLGDCLESMKLLEDNSVDAIVTDPPYGLSFMGKKWDYDVPSQEIWEECLRVLKPGGYLLSFAGTRTQHRMAVRIEDAGFEIRDMIAWVYGSGFPKSLNIGKVTDKFLKTGNASWNGTGDSSNGALGYSKLQHKQDYRPEDYSNRHQNKDKITEEKAKQWEGWGTALKPALEPICMARKPLSEKTVAENVLKYGTGGINIDESRVEIPECDKANYDFNNNGLSRMSRPEGDKLGQFDGGWKIDKTKRETPLGRFPANFIHDGSDEVVGLFPDTGGGKYKAANARVRNNGMGLGTTDSRSGTSNAPDNYGDNGSASRFFYCAKASKSERNRGCEGLEVSEKFTAGNYSQSPTCKTCDLTLNGTNDHTECSGEVYYKEMESKNTKNNHPTVKPIALMEYLVKLVSKEGAVVLDPFAGSGSTLIACKNLNRNYIGCEMDAEYVKIIEARLKDEPNLFNL